LSAYKDTDQLILQLLTFLKLHTNNSNCFMAIFQDNHGEPAPEMIKHLSQYKIQ